MAVFTQAGLRVTAYWHVSIGEQRCSEVFTEQNSCFVPHARSFSHSTLMSLPVCLPDCWVRLFSSVQLIRCSFAEMKPTRHSAAGRFDCKLNANSPPGPPSPFVRRGGEDEGGTSHSWGCWIAVLHFDGDKSILRISFTLRTVHEWRELR